MKSLVLLKKYGPLQVFSSQYSLGREKRQIETEEASKYSFFGLYFSSHNHIKSLALLKKYDPLQKPSIYLLG